MGIQGNIIQLGLLILNSWK